MNFAFKDELTASIRQQIREWLIQKWKEMEGVEPDQDFLDYVEVNLISNYLVLVLRLLYFILSVNDWK